MEHVVFAFHHNFRNIRVWSSLVQSVSKKSVFLIQKVCSSPNEIRGEMNSALIAIGSRNEKLRDLALKKAKKIGKVEIDHGETSCKTPDAKSDIEKIWARKK